MTLEEELELAILNEDYEKAAEIKKKIDITGKNYIHTSLDYYMITS